MSERNWLALVPIAAGIVVGTTLGVSGYYDGVRHGRAEMKHWQDDWYAAHPVVKEVQSISSTLAVKQGESYYLGECNEGKALYFPLESCKVMKFSATDGIIDTGIQLKFSIREDGKWILATPPPKPQKGSKRPSAIAADAYTRYNHGFPEKEPAPTAHEVVSPLIRMLDTHSKDGLSKFYVTIPPAEGHWEIWATDRVNALLRLGSTSWTQSEWKDCKPCAENRSVDAIAEERWKKQLAAPQPAEKP